MNDITWVDRARILRTQFEWPYARIASQLDVPVSTVRYYLNDGYREQKKASVRATYHRDKPKKGEIPIRRKAREYATDSGRNRAEVYAEFGVPYVRKSYAPATANGPGSLHQGTGGRTNSSPRPPGEDDGEG